MKITNGVVSSIVPVLHATVICVLVTSIFCTVGVEMFQEKAPENFSTFLLTFHTLFSVITCGEFPETVLPAFQLDGQMIVSHVVFIYSFILIVYIVLLQVVVVVLLDNFFRGVQQMKIDEAQAQATQALAISQVHPLDPNRRSGLRVREHPGSGRTSRMYFQL